MASFTGGFKVATPNICARIFEYPANWLFNPEYPFLKIRITGFLYQIHFPPVKPHSRFDE